MNAILFPAPFFFVLATECRTQTTVTATENSFFGEVLVRLVFLIVACTFVSKRK